MTYVMCFPSYLSINMSSRAQLYESGEVWMSFHVQPTSHKRMWVTSPIGSFSFGEVKCMPNKMSYFPLKVWMIP